MEAAVPVRDRKVCESYGVSLDNKVICAGGNSQDSCKGDSGGPLQGIRLVNGKARKVQFGIVSAGFKNKDCGDTPAFYANVTHFMEWILDKYDSPKFI